MFKIKRFVAFLVALLMIFMCSCGKEDDKNNSSDQTASASPLQTVKVEDLEKIEDFVITKNDTATPATRNNLNNTLYRLKNDKKLNVVFYGGSVTYGVGASNEDQTSWRVLTTKWLQNKFADAEINSINAAVSGTGSYYGNARLDTDLLSKEPDLVFIEFAINDQYQGDSADQSCYYIESLITRINSQYQYCDIVIAFITDQGLYGKESDIMVAQRKLAEHYGIPCLNLAEPLRNKIGEGDVWKEYLADWVHPADAGYKEYSDAANNFLDGLFAKSVAEYGKHSMPTPMYNNPIQEMSIKEIGKKDADDSTNWRSVAVNNGYNLYSTKAGSEVITEFEGNSIGAYVKYGPTNVATKVHFIVDEKYVKTVSLKWNVTQSQTLNIMNNLDEGKHTLRIVNESGKRCEIMGFFVGQ